MPVYEKRMRLEGKFKYIAGKKCRTTFTLYEVVEREREPTQTHALKR